MQNEERRQKTLNWRGSRKQFIKASRKEILEKQEEAIILGKLEAVQMDHKKQRRKSLQFNLWLV